MPSLAIVILTYNEEKDIERCIQAARLCQPTEIIIVDDNSTDKTVELAQRCSATVYIRSLAGDFSAQRNFALEKVSTDYVFFLDADEVVTEQLADSIKKEFATNKKRGYGFYRNNIAFGKRINHGPLAPEYIERIFPSDSVVWQGKVHEKAVCSCEIILLKGVICHYTYKTWEQYLHKMNQYSTLAAEKMYKTGKKCYIFKDLFLRPLFAFLKMFVLKKGFLDGTTGFALCFFYSMYTFSKYIKLKAIYQQK